MPKIYFQVASQDGWGRHRTEGYTYIDIPSQPGESIRPPEHHGVLKSASLGYYDEHLSCWRPRGDSIFNELRRFFIGGSNELEDISYVAIPKQFQGEKVMKQPLIPLSCKANRCQSFRRKHRSAGLVFEQWPQEHYTYDWTSFFNPSKSSSRSVALKWSDARRSSRTLSMENEKRRGAYALNRYGYVFETRRITRWIFTGFISTDSTRLWPILMLLSVRISIGWLCPRERLLWHWTFVFRCISTCKKTCCGSARVDPSTTFSENRTVRMAASIIVHGRRTQITSFVLFAYSDNTYDRPCSCFFFICALVVLECLTNAYLISSFSSQLNDLNFNLSMYLREMTLSSLFCRRRNLDRMHLRAIIRHRTVLSTSLRILQSYTPSVSSKACFRTSPPYIDHCCP